MKKQNMMANLRMAFDTFFQYWCDHAQSLEALNKVYGKEWKEEATGGEYTIQLLINPNGSLYLVTRRYFVNGGFVREETFLATYGWHSNGHLMGIGDNKILIIDPLKQMVYLEDYLKTGSFAVEEYHEIQNPKP